MTRDDTFAMAREAGFTLYDLHDVDGQDLGESVEADEFDALVRFAKLAVAAEREACAKINDAKAERLAQEAEDAARERDAETVTANRAAALLLTVCAAAIRARKDSA